MGTTKTAPNDGSHKKKKGPGTLATAYLVIYNVVMTAGYEHRHTFSFTHFLINNPQCRSTS